MPWSMMWNMITRSSIFLSRWSRDMVHIRGTLLTSVHPIRQAHKWFRKVPKSNILLANSVRSKKNDGDAAWGSYGLRWTYGGGFVEISMWGRYMVLTNNIQWGKDCRIYIHEWIPNGKRVKGLKIDIRKSKRIL